MRLTLKQLQTLSQQLELSVMGKDGLPIKSVSSCFAFGTGTCFFLGVWEHEKDDLDFEEYYEKNVYSFSENDLVAGEVEICDDGEMKWLGVDLYQIMQGVENRNMDPALLEVEKNYEVEGMLS